MARGRDRGAPARLPACPAAAAAECLCAVVLLVIHRIPYSVYRIAYTPYTQWYTLYKSQQTLASMFRIVPATGTLFHCQHTVASTPRTVSSTPACLLTKPHALCKIASIQVAIMFRTVSVTPACLLQNPSPPFRRRLATARSVLDQCGAKAAAASSRAALRAALSRWLAYEVHCSTTLLLHENTNTRTQGYTNTRNSYTNTVLHYYTNTLNTLLHYYTNTLNTLLHYYTNTLNTLLHYYTNTLILYWRPRTQVVHDHTTACLHYIHYYANTTMPHWCASTGCCCAPSIQFTVNPFIKNPTNSSHPQPLQGALAAAPAACSRAQLARPHGALSSLSVTTPQPIH